MQLLSRRVAAMCLAFFAAWPASAAMGEDKGIMGEWLDQSDKSREEQPHWMTPVVTVTPRLEQEIREDFVWQTGLNGKGMTSYGGQKGLELIPSANSEIILGIPTYQVVRKPQKPVEEGLADENLLLKYRFLTANEEHGNYILTGFLGVTVPTGAEAISKGQMVYTPAVAAGKGWGARREGFDIQSTVSATIPDGNRTALGVPIVWNTALQAHGFSYFWPELEFGQTYWIDGPDATKNRSQWTMTTGLVLGRFQVWERVKAVAGLGYQIPIAGPRTQDHTWLLTTRFPF